MEIELVKVYYTEEEWSKITDKLSHLKMLCSSYYGVLHDLIFDENNGVSVVIKAPSTWRYLLGHKYLLPYRYI